MSINVGAMLGLQTRFRVVVDGVDLGGWSKCTGLAVDFKAKLIKEDFDGGALPWHPDAKTLERTDIKLALLSWLRSPLGKSWSCRIDDNTWMEVIDYLPFARHVPFGPAERGAAGFPAMKLEFRSDRVPFAIEEWMALHPDPRYDLRVFQAGFSMPGQIEFIGVCPLPMLDAFTHPPAKKDLGEKGTVTFWAGGKAGWV